MFVERNGGGGWTTLVSQWSSFDSLIVHCEARCAHLVNSPYASRGVRTTHPTRLKLHPQLARDDWVRALKTKHHNSPPERSYGLRTTNIQPFKCNAQSSGRMHYLFTVMRYMLLFKMWFTHGMRSLLASRVTFSPTASKDLNMPTFFKKKSVYTFCIRRIKNIEKRKKMHVNFDEICITTLQKST